jgi:uncharacterized protein YjiS (DUF1127 family)
MAAFSDNSTDMGVPCAPPEGDIMFKLITFRSDGAFWPLADRPDAADATRSRSLLMAVLTAPRRLAAKILAELAARRAMRSLASLDERMLRDIGIERGQIWHASRYGSEALAVATDLRADLTRWA